MKIRKAEKQDFDGLYTIGVATPEFIVSSSGEFMDREEFLSAILNPEGTFLLAEEGDKFAGFFYANRKDIERGPASTMACLVYLVVIPEYRNQGLAKQLFAAGIKDLKEHGTQSVYGWANAESDGAIIEFLKKQGFSEGHKYIWMDKDI